jgi:hypothetical protein
MAHLFLGKLLGDFLLTFFTLLGTPIFMVFRD